MCPENGKCAVQQVHSLIVNGDLSVVFQPIVSIRSGRIVAFEALSRPNPDSGFHSPGRLFKAAQEYGLLWELEELSRRKTFAAMKGWPSGVRLFFNNSPTVLADERFVPSLNALAAEAGGVPRECLVAEITELSEESMNKELAERAQQLKDAGFGVAIDDVGAGRSGMNRIVQIRPQWIKLDSQFVRTIHADPIRQNLVRFFVHFARMSGISLIAEGVETADELSVLASLDVPFAQGFYLSHPVSRETALSPELAKDVARRWRVLEEHRGGEARGLDSVSRLCEFAPRLHVGCAAGDACATLAEYPQSAGVIVLDGERVVGWAWRSQIERMAAHGGGTVPLGQFMRGSMVRISIHSRMHEALETAGAHDDQTPPDPLLVCDGDSIEGVVRVRDLLRVVLTEGRAGAGSGAARQFGLPGRVEADRHLQDQIDAWKTPGTNAHGDVAFVDIRRLGDVNRDLGYAVGDRLLRCLADLFEGEMFHGPARCFVAHLGDDRFLVTARAGELGPRMCRLVEQFEGAARDVVSSAGFPSGGAGAQRTETARLRVILLDNGLSRIACVRDLYVRERQLREGADAADAADAAASPITVDAPALAA